jgi:hypothetical protein
VNAHDLRSRALLSLSPVPSLSLLAAQSVDFTNGIDNLLSSQASFGLILSLLSSFFVVENEDALVEWVRKAMRNCRDMDLWREEWKEKVKNGEEKDALS